MNSIGKALIITGAFLILLGFVVIIFSRFKIPFLGRLPGDFIITKKNFTLCFPLTTSLILSVFLSLVFYLIFKK